jgi:hypothetical protein
MHNPYLYLYCRLSKKWKEVIRTDNPPGWVDENTLAFCIKKKIIFSKFQILDPIIEEEDITNSLSLNNKIDAIISIINHEMMHIILFRNIGLEACSALDNLEETFWDQWNVTNI